MKEMLIIGNDNRQEILAQMYGANLISEDNKNLKKLIKKSDIIILPLVGAHRVRPRKGTLIIDREKILSDENFPIKNAIPTAEGSIFIALEKSQKTLSESSCLVLGYGNCGKEIVKLLKGFGAKVDIFDKEVDEINEDLTTYDIIFNTIPKAILANEQIAMFSEKIIINIASDEAGFPKECQYPAIPAKHFPASAAKIMKEAIDKIIEEGQNVQK
jgi:dipicolinate synthase subunit A